MHGQTRDQCMISHVIHVGCVAAVYHKPGDKYYAAADYRRFYGSAAY